jgi:hypothetical protein
VLDEVLRQLPSRPCSESEQRVGVWTPATWRARCQIRSPLTGSGVLTSGGVDVWPAAGKLSEEPSPGIDVVVK